MAHRVEVSCHDRLRTAIVQAVSHQAQLELALAAWPARGGTGVFIPPGPKQPWNSAAANLIFALRCEARRTEIALRRAAGLPVRRRGGSDRNTISALRSALAAAAAAETDRVADAAQWLERWNGQAARVLGAASAVIRLPRQPGESERSCPFCACFTLRYWPLHGIVRCINPVCRDDDGRRPSAQIEYSRFTAQIELVWQDGVVGLPQLVSESELVS